MSDKAWKSAASAASVRAAMTEVHLKDVVSAGKALLDKLPDHWHDDATVNFRDAIKDAEFALSKLPTHNPEKEE